MESAPAAADWRAKACGVALWVSLLAYMFVQDFGPKAVGESNWLVIAGKIIMNLLVAGWLYFDAARFPHIDRDRYLGPAVLVTEIAVPYYLVKSRGWKGALRSCLHFFAQLAVVIIVAFVLTVIAKRVLGLSPA